MDELHQWSNKENLKWLEKNSALININSQTEFKSRKTASGELRLHFGATLVERRGEGTGGEGVIHCNKITKWNIPYNLFREKYARSDRPRKRALNHL